MLDLWWNAGAEEQVPLPFPMPRYEISGTDLLALRYSVSGPDLLCRPSLDTDPFALLRHFYY